MPLLNPTFRDAGSAPGSAAHWTLRSVCQRRRAAAFGPAPEGATEDFERWHAWFAELPLPSLVRAVFDAASRAVEGFGAWTPGVFLAAHDDARLEVAAFDGAAAEAFGAAWALGFAADWSEVGSALAPFAGGPVEAFEGWSSTSTPTYAGAAFGGAGAEDFGAGWPALGGI